MVTAAVAIADAGGLDAVTFRAVATRLGAGVMSLYSYVPGKQALVYDMVELVSGELELGDPSGDWRADMHQAAEQQRAILHRHPWLVEALSPLQPLGPATLGYLEWALGALAPTGRPAGELLETVALLNGFIANFVRSELAGPTVAPDAEQAAAQVARLEELLATGRYPRFAGALAQSGPPVTDLSGHFGRLLDRILTGLIQPSGPAHLASESGRDGGDSGQSAD